VLLYIVVGAIAISKGLENSVTLIVTMGSGDARFHLIAMQNIQQTAGGDFVLLAVWCIFTFFLGMYAVMGFLGVALEVYIWACWFMVDSSDPEETYARPDTHEPPIWSNGRQLGH
jgi:hypothetical protein